jgi:NAD(P)-dependent dehydrogenase (short-subunit alcohol dehydrogenase family)
MADVRQCIDTKIIGQMLCVRHAAKRLSAGGSIVLIAGGAGYKAMAGMSITGAANAGIGAMGRSLAVELAPLRVNVVVGGVIDTPLWGGLPADARQAMFEDSAKTTPVGRIGQPADVASTVLHALDNTFLSGAVLHVDGGIVL